MLIMHIFSNIFIKVDTYWFRVIYNATIVFVDPKNIGKDVLQVR